MPLISLGWLKGRCCHSVRGNITDANGEPLVAIWSQGNCQAFFKQRMFSFIGRYFRLTWMHRYWIRNIAAHYHLAVNGYWFVFRVKKQWIFKKAFEENGKNVIVLQWGKSESWTAAKRKMHVWWESRPSTFLWLCSPLLVETSHCVVFVCVSVTERASPVFQPGRAHRPRCQP